MLVDAIAAQAEDGMANYDVRPFALLWPFDGGGALRELELERRIR